MGVILGIDFGMTNTTVSYVDADGTVKLIPSSNGYPYFPTLVYIDPSEYYVYTGESALYAGADDPQGLIRNIKAFVGNELFTYDIGGRSFHVEYVIELFLKSVMHQVAEHLGDVEIDGAVISCPCHYTKKKIMSIVNAAEKVALPNGKHLKVLNAVNGLVAASVAYYLPRNEQKKVLLYDLGGTFDVALVNVDTTEGGIGINVLGATGDNQLGGDEWTCALEMYLIEQFAERTGIDEDTLFFDMDTRFDIRQKAERAKIILSTSDVASVNPAHGYQREKITVTRELLQELTEFQLLHTLSLTDKLLFDCETDPDSIDEILLCGRATRMSQVKEALARSYGKPVVTSDPDSLVSIGAAMIGSGFYKGI